MKRKIFAVMICTLVLGCALPVAVLGVEVQDMPAVSGNHTVFTRVWEYINIHKTEIVSIAGDAVFLFALLRSVLKSRKKNESIASQLVSLKKDSSAIPEIVKVINLLIDGFNTMSIENNKIKTVYENSIEADEDRNRVIGALLAQTTALLEIVTTGYANSDLPQGIKDLVTLKYAKCLRSIDDDTAKCAVEAARAVISGVDDPCKDKAVDGERAEVEPAEV